MSLFPVSTEKGDCSLTSPPSSPCHNDSVVIATDHLGMSTENDVFAAAQNVSVPAKKPRSRKHVSKHFSPTPLARQRVQSKSLATTTTPPATPAQPKSRQCCGLILEDVSSDSSLTDVPDDIGPDPFEWDSDSDVKPPTKVQAVKINRVKAKCPSKSPYFPHAHRYRPTFLSTLPFPPLLHLTFGLMQERLAHDPFRLLIATIFLNKTRGEQAMPVFYQLMEKYPTPAALAAAEVSDVTGIIHKLGFQNQRARKCVAMANVWVESPPVKGRRTKKMNYPNKGDGRDVGATEVLEDADARVAWEISHLPGLGPYSHDSWRMFCRDKLRAVASSWQGEDAEQGFEPEWKRVVPADKELRAYLTWMWLKEGSVWNKETGARTEASKELLEEAGGGGVVLEEREKEHLVVKGVDAGQAAQMKPINQPAGIWLKKA